MMKTGPNCYSHGSLMARWMDRHPLSITQCATDGINAPQKCKAFGFCFCLSDVSVAHAHGYYCRLVNSCCSRHYTRFQSGPSLEMAAVCESDEALKTHQLADIAPHPVLQLVPITPLQNLLDKVSWSTEKKNQSVTTLSCTSDPVEEFKLLVTFHVCYWNR